MSEDSTPANSASLFPVDKEFSRLALGAWVFGGAHWAGQSVHDSKSVMEVALRRGMNHFDTAEGYGDGRSETLIGDFLRAEPMRREKVFLATKGYLEEPTAATIRKSLQGSLERLGVEYVDLYYVHWPRHSADLRPVFEELQRAKDEGKIRAIGASNFNIAQLDAARSVCAIHAHQFCYNLLWRFPERDLIPYGIEHNIASVAYSAIAQGILAGAFPAEPYFAKGDLRAKTVMFEHEVWPAVFAAVEQMKVVAAEAKRPLVHLAIRWLLSRETLPRAGPAAQAVEGATPTLPAAHAALAASKTGLTEPGSLTPAQSASQTPTLTAILVGARNAVQLNELAGALGGDIPQALLDKLTAISDAVRPAIPAVGNIFRFYP